MSLIDGQMAVHLNSRTAIRGAVMRILIIEDNDDVVFIEEMLEGRDGKVAYEIEYAENFGRRLPGSGVSVLLFRFLA